MFATALSTELWAAVSADPFLGVATLLLFAAVLHAFCAPMFARAALRRERVKADFRAAVLHLCGEVEAVFGLWSAVLCFVAIVWPGKGWTFAVTYLETADYVAATSGIPALAPSKFHEPLFVFIIMAMAAARPIVEVAQRLLAALARLFGGTPAARWFVVLTVAPLLGSLVTEPAAMTIAAYLLAHQFYRLKPSANLQYATLALLFVNISVGGALTHFAAPPIVMVAARWQWGTPEVFQQFGIAALITIVVGNTVYFYWFRRELRSLVDPVKPSAGEPTVPLWLTGSHLLLMAGVVFLLSGHHAGLMVGVFSAFLALHIATPRWQWPLRLRAPFMVGFFLAGLVVLGGLQGWWIGPVLAQLSEGSLLAASVVLTAFNDNAAITYLASQVPALAEPTALAAALRHAVMAGALAGGGLTVIANAPNPAGQAILGEYFEGGVSPGKLLVWALLPTALATLFFVLFR